MTGRPYVVIRVYDGGRIAKQLREDPPSAIKEGQVAVEPVRDEDDNDGSAGQVVPPGTGGGAFVIRTLDALMAQRIEVREKVADAGGRGEPFHITVESADEIRNEHVEMLLEAAENVGQVVIIRVLDG
jgi:hypothetical protein